MRKSASALTLAAVVLSVSPSFASMSMPSPTPPAISGTAAKAGGTIFDASVPATVANTTLINSLGKKFSLADYKGKYIVLTDFFTSCDMICPMTSVNMRDIGDAVKSSKIKNQAVVLEVSIDPARDTVARIKAYQSLFGDSSWTIATGDPKSLSTFWGWFGVFSKAEKNVDGSAPDWQTGKPVTYDVVHDDVVIIIDPKGHWRWLELGNPSVSNPTTLPTTLKRYLSTLGRLNLIHPQEPSWSVSAVYGAFHEIFNISLGSNVKK